MLPDNFAEVDAALLKVWQDSNKAVKQGKLGKYTRASLAYTELEQNVRISYLKCGECHEIPEEQISFKKKLIYTPVIYRLGMVLFKKGSRIRSFLKKHM